MTLDPVTLSSLILIGTAFGGAFLAALWLSLIFWTYRDIRQRTRDPLMRILAVIVAVFLFLPGILIYLVLRPSTTFNEEYQRSLEEEALLQTIEEKPACTGCGRLVSDEWILCPSCHTELKRTCTNCKRPLEIQWTVCPFCGYSKSKDRSSPVEINPDEKPQSLSAAEL